MDKEEALEMIIAKTEGYNNKVNEEKVKCLLC